MVWKNKPGTSCACDAQSHASECKYVQTSQTAAPECKPTKCESDDFTLQGHVCKLDCKESENKVPSATGNKCEKCPDGQIAQDNKCTDSLETITAELTKAADTCLTNSAIQPDAAAQSKKCCDKLQADIKAKGVQDDFAIQEFYKINCTKPATKTTGTARTT